MFTKIIGKVQYLFKSDDQEVELATPMDVTVEFELYFKKMIIGTLRLHQGMWSFSYSEEFTLQNEISPIVDFPDKTKTYQSHGLFPFFSSRIPSIQRLKLQKVIPHNVIQDEVALLKAFGKQTITNPYQLIPN
jgi:HipA-like protein